jgi:dTDP-4-amino-4,6-dideoxygalactose transaminase
VSAVRHQLAAYSPLTAGAAGAALLDAAGRVDPRDALAERLRARFGARHVALCASGTHALQCALAGRAPVALPAYACYDLATAAVGAGVCVALYDVDPLHLAPDPASLERVLAAGARTVVVAPLYGIPVDWAALERLASAYGARLIEDAAQGHGASWRGRALGSLGETSILSFGRGKGWTGGGGGALLSRDPHADGPAGAPGVRAEAVAAAAVAAQWALGRPWLYGIPMSVPSLGLGRTVYHDPTPVRPMRRAAAALAARTEAPADAEAAHRRASAAGMLASLPAALAIQVSPDASPGYLRLPLRIPGGIGALRDPGRARRLGAAPGYPTPLSDLPALQGRLTGPERRWPGAASLARDLVTFPTHSRVTPADRAELLGMLR